MGQEHQDPVDPMEVLTAHIVRKGLRMTRQRRLIAEVLLNEVGHLNIDELFGLVRKKDPHVGYATLYRTVKLLVECGLVTSAQFGDGSARFESAVNRPHHDHLICTECACIIEFENEEIEALQVQECEKHNFLMRHHKMEIYGLCINCQ
jgi:Fur family ferric uptake transcriptional regulator